MKDCLQILVADDDFEDRTIMSECFKDLGHSNAIKFVEDGSELLTYLDNKTDEIVTLIVLDLNMPRLNGTETLRMLKSIPGYSNIPVIIFSTSVNEIERKNCMALGAREYVTKAGKWDEYLDTCRRLYSISQEPLQPMVA